MNQVGLNCCGCDYEKFYKFVIKRITNIRDELTRRIFKKYNNFKKYILKCDTFKAIFKSIEIQLKDIF